MTDKTQYFHFTLGPVQSFVGQARRTRDFWAGSFILSWLSGVAMLAVKAQIDDPELKEKCILFPEADPNFLNFLEGKGEKENEPEQGSIPNRFKAEVNGNFSGEKVVQAVQEAWMALANKVYDKDFIKTGLDNHKTKVIWDRQVQSFWDMSWAMTPDKADTIILDRRKNWRSQFLPDEPGIKCSLMGDWQELSGMPGVQQQERLAREAFWNNVANRCRVSDFSDKREHLCAMAYIKRRFDKHFSEFKTTVLNESLKIHGWQVPSSVPSVGYIAAAPWFGELLRKNNKEPIPELQIFIDIATAPLTGQDNKYLPEREAKIKCIRDENDAPEVFGIDGNMLHEIALDNPNVFPKNKTHPGVDWNRAQKTKETLKPLLQKYGAVSPFYAVLMMDGDSLGKQMSILKKQDGIAKGLADFTKSVSDIVWNNNGFLIYAGGDDVLALLPLEDALQCAAELRAHYQSCFTNRPVETSISAAIIYTHINTPMKNVLRDAHELLDDVAKDGAGRDALAVRVYKSSGIALEWTQPWHKALVGSREDKSKHNVTRYIIEDILDKVKPQKEKDNKKAVDNEGIFSNKFLHKIRHRFAMFEGDTKADNSEAEIQNSDLANVLSADFMQSINSRIDTVLGRDAKNESEQSKRKKITLTQAQQTIKPLLLQCKSPIDGRIKVDAALLVRFLAQKGIERGGK